MQKMMKKVWQRRRGFTLIELLIVVAIIGILAGIAIPNFLGARTRARVAKSFADMDAIAKAEEMYFVDHGNYTNSTSELAPGYVGVTVMSDPWGNEYKIYTSPGASPTMYLIVGGCVDQDIDVTTTDISWDDDERVRGAIGGSEGAEQGYNVDKWYNPENGVNSSGDIGYGSG